MLKVLFGKHRLESLNIRRKNRNINIFIYYFILPKSFRVLLQESGYSKGLDLRAQRVVGSYKYGHLTLLHIYKMYKKR